MRKPSVFLVALGLFLAACWVSAQGTTASLTGTVTSEGKALPGVTVTVSSPELQGTRTKVTGANGVYNFSALPPGDYTIAFELQGIQPVTKKVRLILAETTRTDADMSVSKVKEEVTVSGQPVDPPRRETAARKSASRSGRCSRSTLIATK